MKKLLDDFNHELLKPLFTSTLATPLFPGKHPDITKLSQVFPAILVPHNAFKYNKMVAVSHLQVWGEFFL